LAEQIGGVGRALARGLWPKISDTSQSDKNIQNCHILCGTPNRIINMLDAKELDLSKCQMIVLDECDKMLEITNKLNPDDPKSFSAQVNLLRSQCADNHQMGLFSATMSGSVEKFGHANFNNEGVTVAIGKSGNAVNQNVSQKVIYCGNERGKLLALREFIKDGFRPPAILFTETKERCQRIMGELLYDGINAMSLCAAKSNADRQKVIQATRVGKVWLLITTDVASRGLDLPMTSTVINYDCPNSVTDYVHRVGRCGRYNRSGHAITFFSDADRDRIRILRGVMVQSGAELPQSVMNLAKADLNDKKRVKTQKVEREELQTKVPKKNPLAVKKFKNRMTKMAIVDRKRIRKQNNLKVLESGNDAEDGGEWETAK